MPLCRDVRSASAKGRSYVALVHSGRSRSAPTPGGRRRTRDSGEVFPHVIGGEPARTERPCQAPRDGFDLPVPLSPLMSTSIGRIVAAERSPGQDSQAP